MWTGKDSARTLGEEKEWKKGTNENCHNFHYDDFYNSSYRCHHHHLHCRSLCEFFLSWMHLSHPLFYGCDHTQILQFSKLEKYAARNTFFSTISHANTQQAREFSVWNITNPNSSHAECFWAISRLTNETASSSSALSAELCICDGILNFSRAIAEFSAKGGK